jgi:hypothetical protein
MGTAAPGRQLILARDMQGMDDPLVDVATNR